MKSFFSSLWNREPLSREEVRASDLSILLSRTRRALEAGQVDRARHTLGFGELLASDNKVEYFLRCGDLWREFGYSEQAYVRFLEAEAQAALVGEVWRERVSDCLFDFESHVALAFARRKVAPHAGFWASLVSHRDGVVHDFSLSDSWDDLLGLSLLTESTLKSRALESVQLLGLARFSDSHIGNVGSARLFVSQSSESFRTLDEFRRFVRSLRRWPDLSPVTVPWLAVLDSVLE